MDCLAQSSGQSVAAVCAPPGMLLVPRALGLPEMLQTIYETESCFSSDGVSGCDQSLELLSRAQIHTLPVAGECGVAIAVGLGVDHVAPGALYFKGSPQGLSRKCLWHCWGPILQGLVHPGRALCNPRPAEWGPMALQEQAPTFFSSLSRAQVAEAQHPQSGAYFPEGSATAVPPAPPFLK